MDKENEGQANLLADKENSMEASEYVGQTQVLDADEVAEADAIISKLHPLSTVPFKKVFPFCKLCCPFGCKKKIRSLNVFMCNEFVDQDANLERILQQYNTEFEGTGKDDKYTQKLRATKEALDRDEDPDVDFNTMDAKGDVYAKLGFGFEAYFRMIKCYLGLFVAFSLMALPAMYIYQSQDGLKGSRVPSNAKYSLGNMGFSESVVINQWAEIPNNRTLECATGEMLQLNSWGVIPASSPPVQDQSAFVGTQAEAATEGYTNIVACSEQFLDRTDNDPRKNQTIQDVWYDECFQKSECSLDFTQFINLTRVAEQDSLAITCFGAYNTSLPLMEQPVASAMRIYIQMTCEQKDADVSTKRVLGLAVSCIMVAICLIFWIANYYLSRTSDLLYKTWDVNTTTVADFTVEYEISQAKWDFYKKEVFGDQAPDANMDIFAFSNFLKEKIIARIQNVPFVIDEDEQRVGISRIAFAYDNVELIKVLKERGACLISGKLDKLEVLETQLNELTMKRKELTRPVTAFITFETQEAYERASLYWTKDCPEAIYELVEPADKNMLGDALYFSQANEPSNILWENLKTTDRQILCKEIGAWLLIIIFLCAMFTLFAFLQQFTSKIQSKYPPTQDCDPINDMFKTEQLAPAYYTFAELDRPYTLQSKGTGVYQCFCELTSKNATIASYVDVQEKIQDATKTLCHDFTRSLRGGSLLSYCVSGSVTLVNMIIRSMNIFLISKVGYHSYSAQTARVVDTIFIATFINTAFVLLLGNANMENNALSFLDFFFHGEYTDMTQNWYLDIAPALISTMMFNSVYVYIDFGIAFGTKKLFQALDKGGCLCCKRRVTKCTTIQSYVNLYSGAEHSMNYKYALILSTSFITFMFGLALPLLYPIAAFTFLNLYLMERVLVTYWHPKPPMYDDKLNKKTLSIISWAPIFLCFFGYWFLGQPQIFDNMTTTKEYTYDKTITNHTAAPSVGPDMPMFIFTIFFAIWIFVQGWARKLMIKCKVMQPVEEPEVNEGLGAYFECVPAFERKCQVAQEVYNRQKLNIQTMKDSEFHAMRTAHGLKKIISGTPTYDMLDNQAYTSAFSYISVELRGDPEEELMTDPIIKMLNMGYVKETDVTHFSMKNMKKLLGQQRKQKKIKRTGSFVENKI